MGLICVKPDWSLSSLWSKTKSYQVSPKSKNKQDDIEMANHSTYHPSPHQVQNAWASAGSKPVPADRQEFILVEEQNDRGTKQTRKRAAETEREKATLQERLRNTNQELAREKVEKEKLKEQLMTKEQLLNSIRGENNEKDQLSLELKQESIEWKQAEQERSLNESLKQDKKEKMQSSLQPQYTQDLEENLRQVSQQLAGERAEKEQMQEKMKSLEQDIIRMEKSLEQEKREKMQISLQLQDKQDLEENFHQTSEQLAEERAENEQEKEEKERLSLKLEQESEKWKRIEKEKRSLEESLEHEKMDRQQLDLKLNQMREDLTRADDELRRKEKDLKRAKDKIAELEKSLEEVTSNKRRKPNDGAEHDPASKNCWVVPTVIYNDDRITKILHQLMSRVDEKMDVTSRDSASITLRHAGRVLLPCIAASRVGSDLQAAVDKAKLGAVAPIVIIYHHLAPHNCRIHTATKDRLSDRKFVDQCQDMIDVVFWNGSMYDCDANHRAVKRLKELVEEL